MSELHVKKYWQYLEGDSIQFSTYRRNGFESGDVPTHEFFEIFHFDDVLVKLLIRLNIELTSRNRNTFHIDQMWHCSNKPLHS